MELKEKIKTKELKDLTDKELLEDLAYYVNYAQHQAPAFVDQTFNCIWDDIKESFRRLEKIPKHNCNQCNLYGECDHQGAYQKNGKWCYE